MTEPVALALRAAGIGDILTAVPALRALAAALPDHRVVVGAPAWLRELVDLIPGVGALVPVEGIDGHGRSGRPSRWALPRPALAVNLHGSGPQSHEALLATGPGELWAYRCSPVWTDGPVWDDRVHERERWCRLLEWHGVPADPTALALHRPTTDAPVRGAVVVHLGGTEPRRRLGPEAAATAAGGLARLGHDIVLTGGSADAARAAEVAATAGLGREAVLAGRVGLAGTAALVAAARLVVSGDTGVAHLASAYATPSVVVFGPESEERWGPPPRPVHRVLHDPAADARAVPGSRVLEAVLDVLARAAPPRVGAESGVRAG